MSHLLALTLATLLQAAPPAAVVHGGAGSPRARMDGTDRAAAQAAVLLKGGGSALDAALAAVVILEDDPRFNAGTGANIRLDGKTIQMDAACMDGETGAFGAVAAIERVKNPVLVARKVMDTPHILIVGEGATRFARAMGFPDYDPACQFGDAEIQQAQSRSTPRGTGRGEPGQHQVAGLHVAVGDAHLVRVGQGFKGRRRSSRASAGARPPCPRRASRCS